MLQGCCNFSVHVNTFLLRLRVCYTANLISSVYVTYSCSHLRNIVCVCVCVLCWCWVARCRLGAARKLLGGNLRLKLFNIFYRDSVHTSQRTHASFGANRWMLCEEVMAVETYGTSKYRVCGIIAEWLVLNPAVRGLTSRLYVVKTCVTKFGYITRCRVTR